jgi:hypothetical protein
MLQFLRHGSLSCCVSICVQVMHASRVRHLPFLHTAEGGTHAAVFAPWIPLMLGEHLCASLAWHVCVPRTRRAPFSRRCKCCAQSVLSTSVSLCLSLCLSCACVCVCVFMCVHDCYGACCTTCHTCVLFCLCLHVAWHVCVPTFQWVHSCAHWCA